MIRNHLIGIIVILGSYLNLTSLNAQELTLFEEIEQPETTSNNNTQSRAVRRAQSSSSTPEFTLLGTSRIGDNYSAMLRHRDGEALSVKLAADDNTRIPGYSDYTVVQVESGSVSVRYPDNQPCQANEERGVRCSSADNIAILGLVTAEPVLRQEAIRLEDEIENAGNPDGEVAGEAGDQASRNPFEAIRAAARNGANPASGEPRRFEPRRIAPEDVPEGMRVVSTPFGDRLVQE
ncbi:MAG: hypothetical protein MRY76_07845 [Pseudomonadales bacterium]|nr:hypothetical protein [Pseudomonadales bacterium]